jgi:hypothetical protein
MRATALEVTASTALVELRPSWLARKLGAQIVNIELEAAKPVHGSDSPWRTVANHRTLSWSSTGRGRRCRRRSRSGREPHHARPLVARRRDPVRRRPRWGRGARDARMGWWRYQKFASNIKLLRSISGANFAGRRDQSLSMARRVPAKWPSRSGHERRKPLTR